MFKNLFVFMALLGIVTGHKCYDYMGLTTEFISLTETCEERFCMKVTTDAHKDLIVTDCSPLDCSNDLTIDIAKLGMGSLVEMTGLPALTEDEQNALKLECCESDLCHAPTTTIKTNGVQCYEYDGEISKMDGKGPKCNYGGSCLTVIMRDRIATKCIMECSDFVKSATITTIRKAIDLAGAAMGLPKITDAEVKAECCVENLCNGKYMADGEKGTTPKKGTEGEKGTTPKKGTEGEKGTTPKKGTEGEKGTTVKGTEGEKSTTGKKDTEGEKGITATVGTEASNTTEAPTKGVGGLSLFSLLPFTLALLSIVYSMQ